MIARFEIRPLGPWNRPITNPRTPANKFRAKWDDTLDLLVFEVGKLDGELIVIQVDADPADIRRDGMLRARARVGFPGVVVSFGSKHGPLSYATDQYEENFYGDMPGWQANVRAVALSLQALRAVDRYGVTRSGEQYRGWNQLTAGPAQDAMTVEEAVIVLANAAEARAEFVQGFADVLRDAAGPQPFVSPQSVTESREAINRLYKIATRTAHPDAGGNADAFRLINRARDVLLGGAA